MRAVTSRRTGWTSWTATRCAAPREELGAVDVLVFTAATNVRKRLVDYTDEEFDRVVDLNLRASFDLVRAFGPGMAERGRGSIIGFTLDPRGDGGAGPGRLRRDQGGAGAAAAHGRGRARAARGAGQRGGARRGRDAADRADPRRAGVVRRVRRARARSAGGRGRTSSPARWPTWPPTRPASSPGRCCSSTAGGRRSTAATSRPPEPATGAGSAQPCAGTMTFQARMRWSAVAFASCRGRPR